MPSGADACHQYGRAEPQGIDDRRGVTKIFHFARFDVAIMKQWLGITISPVYCTKIASKLVRTYTDRHGLKDVTRELLGIDLSKAQQSSDWASAELSDAQIAYAASDVLNLHAIKDRLDEMLAREGRTELCASLLRFFADPRGS